MLSFFILVLGLVIGSFLNVVIYRLPEETEDSIVLSRSHCPSCGKQLAWYDLIPIFSYLFLKGKCRYCGEKISLQYPVIEFINGLLYLLLFLKFGLSIELLIYAPLFSALLVGAVIDIKSQILPDKITLTGMVFGIIITLTTNFVTIQQALIGFAVGFIPLFLLVMVKPGSMGGGDIKLMGMLGIFIGWQGVLNIHIISSISASIINIALILFKGNDFKQKFAFGPYLILGAYISVLLLNNVLLYYFIM